ncbi:WD40-repeat-containing domain protein [Crucibulum laeve]|uniref:WD40-repeat-containing domain protein n=1 Tax=Crucibulum laeve TaxID=68775 RepID=A0A5C3MBL8_9AGAR|nr:WD40-repeat-containing domain protein [Crucibulum laeve]
MAEIEGLGIDLYSLHKTLLTPAHISSLAFGHAGHLFAGSDDGSLRVYDLSSFKVLKAIRGLESEVSSIICVKRPGSELRDAWIACGRRICKFQMDSSKMIQMREDAVSTIEVGESDEDILNELAINTNKSHLAFSTDSGTVGVIDLLNNAVSTMKVKHESVCGSVKFIPERAREIVSGGYDTNLIHFDFTQGTELSRQKMDPFINVGGMALAPPFIMAMAMSPVGVLAAGTADGRLWIGFGGEKASADKKKKKTRIWEGLKREEALLIKVAEGPIVALTFTDPRTLIISTLMGLLTQYQLVYDETEGSVILKQIWKKESTGIEKVNTLLADDKRLVVGGFAANGKGVIEIWKQEAPHTSMDIPK